MTVLTLENLIARQKNLQNVLDNMMEGIIAHDLNRQILFFNRAAEKITGYSREDVLGRDCHLVFGSPFCGNKCSFCGQSPESLGHHTYTINAATRSGDTRRIEMSVTGMYDEEGAFVGVLAAFRDLTEIINLQLRLGELTGFSGIVGRDGRMLDVYEQIRNLAAADYPVHITGETGTGKELVAAAIHNESARAGGPFVPVNCGALPEGLLESELFGHVKGAFSGAIRDKKGRFELADGGTLFLDEVSELPRHMQVKLLRVLQKGSFERVGAEKTISVNVRIISATNRDLKREMERQNFREDLYYRLSVVPIRIPPLRERRNDIPLLAFHFLKLAAEHGRKAPRLSEEALSLMMDYGWPGNVRELQNTIHFALVKSRGPTIEAEHLPLEIRQMTCTTFKPGPKPRLTSEAVASAVEKAGGNRSKAAKLLGIGRATLYRFLEKQL
ncbi:MAG TPA: sigma 54-interacting transcriptional regulator [Deltaproteobacteria bacterium]|jgi:PAS domain S-box-containing protein|nr:sigma 54-interacting transcriptional regulator [Deltaproteobacteria bacterium]